jgi:hypothetical protein
MSDTMRIEWYWDGKVATYLLPDGTTVRRSPRSTTTSIELVREHYRSLGGAEPSIVTFTEIAPPSNRQPRQRPDPRRRR